MTAEVPLSQDQRTALQLIYDRFRARGAWTTFGDVDRQLRRLGLNSDTVIQSLAGSLLLPFDISRLRPITRDELKLSLRAINLCQGGQEDIDSFLRLLPWLAEKELEFNPDDAHPEADLRVKMSEIREFLELPHDSAGPIDRLRQLISLQRWGWSGGEIQPGDWFIQVDRGIFRFANVSTLDDYLEAMNKWEEEGRQPYATVPDELIDPAYAFAVEGPSADRPTDTYVPQDTVAAIQEAAPQSFWNCGKLLRLIDELNEDYASDRTYSAHAILRAILDHVPPVLGFRDFNAVANNYDWSQTDKKYMKRLLAFKDQADDVLHRQISARSDLLTIEDMPQRVCIIHLLQECTDKLL